jgi:Leu/Phe-tRNA-protein transferase
MDIWQGRIATGASIQGPRGEAYRKLAAEGFAHSKEMYFLWLQRDAKPKRKRG